MSTRVGDRIMLIACTDPYTLLRYGDMGTVNYIDGTGTVFVHWDSGSNLGLVPGEDSWVVVEPPSPEQAALFEGLSSSGDYCERCESLNCRCRDSLNG